MVKYILTTFFILSIVTGKAQTFSYSDNHVNNPVDATIIGQVKDNIIVWCEDIKEYKLSTLLVYDKNLKLIRKQTTNILRSDIDPSARFYHNDDSFYVAYQYRKAHTWVYKMAGYDNEGTLASTYTIDSVNDFDSDDKVYYNLCQSADKKVICCVKTISSARYNALRFEFTCLSGGILYRDSLFLSFDKIHEKVIDFLVDNNRNVTLLKTSRTDTGFVVFVIKKEFSSNHFLIAAKNLATGDLRDGACQFFYKPGQYTVTGVWEDLRDELSTKRRSYQTGLYSWKLTDNLTDMPGDTVLPYDSGTLSRFTHYTDSYLSNITDDFYGIEADSVPIKAMMNRQDDWTLAYQGFGTNGISQYTQSGGFYQYIYSHDTLSTQNKISHYKADFSLARFTDDNKIVWQYKLKTDADKSLLTDLSNNKIVAGKKGIHIVRLVFGKNKKSSIEHVLITYSGQYEKINTTLWDNKYIYLIPDAVDTNDGSLIIPCLQGNKLSFTKMNLD